MPQAQSTRAVDAMSDSNPKVLEDNMTITRNSDGSVVLKTIEPRGFLPNGEEKFRITEKRVDSENDLDHTRKGGKLWYDTLLKQQKTRDAATATKGGRKKPEVKS